MKKWVKTRFKSVRHGRESVRVPDLNGLEQAEDARYSVCDLGSSKCLAVVSLSSSRFERLHDSDKIAFLSDKQVVADSSNPLTPSTLEKLDQPDIEVDRELDQLEPEKVLKEEELQRVYLIQNWRYMGESKREDVLDTLGAANLRDAMRSGVEDIGGVVERYGIDKLPDSVKTSRAVRSVVQRPTCGTKLLQDQELTAMNKIAKAQDRPRSEELPHNTREVSEGVAGETSRRLLLGHLDPHGEMLDYLKKDYEGSTPWGSERPPGSGSVEI